MGIKHRIWALPAIAALLFAVGLAITGWATTSAIASITGTERVDYPFLDQIKAVGLEVQGISSGLKEAVTEGDKKRISIVEKQAQAVREHLKTIAAIPGQAETAERLRTEFEAYYVPARRVAGVMLGLDSGDADADIAPMQKALTALESDLTATNEAARQRFTAGILHSSDLVHSVLRTCAQVATVVILTLAIVSFYVVRSIWQQLGGEPAYAGTIAHAVAEGDLSMNIVTSAGDEHSVLAELKTMRSRLSGIVGDISRAARTIGAASDDIAAGNAHLSSRTESQASSLEQTASAMEALTDTVQRNAAHAQQASELALAASEVAIKGGTVVGEVIATMNDIHTSASKIADIISVIDSIAFQTNILALNAAVEAARAGEQGRGFAVVASEVRNLAQRAAGSAKEIRELIQISVEKVAAGSELVDGAGKTMDDIRESVKRVTNIMSEIAVASKEQSTGIAEVGKAVSLMDKMTQQNAALVEQAAASAQSLRAQAGVLSASLAVFKLGADVQAGAGVAAVETATRRLALPFAAKEGRPA